MANRNGTSRAKSKRVEDGADHLAKYLNDEDLSYSAFGEQVGCTKAHVCGLINRKSKPSGELAARMEQRTGGKIPQASWWGTGQRP